MNPALAALACPLPFEVIETYHPAVAVAILNGGRLRPNIRTLLADFTTSAQVGKPVNAVFTGAGSNGLTPVPISAYSIFGGIAHTIDPTRAGEKFPNNPLAAVSDAALQDVPGLTFKLIVQGDNQGGTNYAPAPDDVPFQHAEILNSSRGTWAFDIPDSFQAVVTLQNQNNLQPPFKAWLTVVFFVLDIAGRQCFDPWRSNPAGARAELCRIRAAQAAACAAAVTQGKG